MCRNGSARGRDISSAATAQGVSAATAHGVCLLQLQPSQAITERTDFRVMYETFYKLKERPFSAAPLPSRYFPAANIEHARQSLHRAIGRADGAGLIVGPSGTGKTLLLQLLADEFRDRFQTVLLASGRLNSVRALFQSILFNLNLPYRQMDESELRLSLLDHLSPSQLPNSGLLLLLDEAHNMSWRLIEEVRMITNLVHDGQPRVRVVLAGNPKLEERFASPRLDSFSQRLAVRCYLESFSCEETAGYVRSQIEAVGGDPSRIMADDTFAAVHRATEGIPRLINQVCDHALLLSSLGGHHTLSAAAIEEAWADLQQLPAPWTAKATAAPTGMRVIEFGGLDDAEDDRPAAIPFPAVTTHESARESSLMEFGQPVAGPEQQIDQLESHLNELEEDFRPAGAIRPEVELIFQGGNNPFGDQFVEEEVVLDRYASLESDVFDRRPLVASREGRELGELLAPHAQQAAEPVVPLERMDASAEPTSGTTTLESGGCELHVDDEDADLIVIEEDFLAATQAAPPPLVRKQEYRQLFARLRRG